MSRLDEILTQFYEDSIDAYDAFMGKHTDAQGDDEASDRVIDQAKADIQKLFLEVVGEDEPTPPTIEKEIEGRKVYDQLDDLLRPGRNDLRAELRKKIKEAL